MWSKRLYFHCEACGRCNCFHLILLYIFVSLFLSNNTHTHFVHCWVASMAMTVIALILKIWNDEIGIFFEDFFLLLRSIFQWKNRNYLPHVAAFLNSLLIPKQSSRISWFLYSSPSSFGSMKVPPYYCYAFCCTNLNWFHFPCIFLYQNCMLYQRLSKSFFWFWYWARERVQTLLFDTNSCKISQAISILFREMPSAVITFSFE